MTINYKYDEGDLLREITQYIDATYGEHYSQNQYQATEFIIDGGHGIGFTVGNILKYAQRYGHKGTPADWRTDLLKVIHYAIIAMHVHDKEYSDVVEEESRYRLDTVTFDIDTAPFKGRTATFNPADWSQHNMGTSSLLTSIDIPGIIDLTETNSKKTKKKKD